MEDMKFTSEIEGENVFVCLDKIHHFWQEDGQPYWYEIATSTSRYGFMKDWCHFWISSKKNLKTLWRISHTFPPNFNLLLHHSVHISKEFSTPFKNSHKTLLLTESWRHINLTVVFSRVKQDVINTVGFFSFLISNKFKTGVGLTLGNWS